VQEARDRRLRQHDEPRLRALRQRLVGPQRGLEAAGDELQRLRHVSLQQRDADRRPVGLRPLGAQGELARDHDGRDCRSRGREAPAFARRGQRERTRDHRRGEARAIHADKREQAVQRSADLRVAQREPWKAGEQPAAKPLGQRPQRGHREQQSRRGRGRQPRLQRADRGGKQREIEAEEQRGEGGERRGHHAEVVQAHVHPRHADEEVARAKGETQPCGAARRRGARPQPGERGERQDGHGEQRGVAEARHRGRARGGCGRRGPRGTHAQCARGALIPARRG
jgi:hypothetical protein